MGTNTFPRLLTALRKERGLSQKEAAVSLKISQALLSHYERGIRECGLDFIVRAADYYGVSCDYLLGRTTDKSGAMIAAEDLPGGNTVKSGQVSGGLPTVNRNQILNAVCVLFDVLQRYNNKALTDEASRYLFRAVYVVFRSLYEADGRNAAATFSVPRALYRSAASGAMLLSATRLATLTAEMPDDVPVLSPAELTRLYPLFASSLLNLLKDAETDLPTA